MRVRYPWLAIWMTLPHASSRIAVATEPVTEGACVKRTPKRGRLAKRVAGLQRLRALLALLEDANPLLHAPPGSRLATARTGRDWQAVEDMPLTRTSSGRMRMSIRHTHW